MKLKPLKSSKAPTSTPRLAFFKFKSGGTYAYEGCKQHHYDGLCSAESAGGYFHAKIRGSFKHRKADAKKAT